MDRYIFSVPKAVTATQIDFDDYQSLVQAVLLCGAPSKTVDEIKKFTDEHIVQHDDIKYLLIEDWIAGTVKNPIAAKHGDYVVVYDNPYNNMRTIEVVEQIIFERYATKMADIMRKSKSINKEDE